MNRPTRHQTLWTGLTILLVVNAFALGGAAWNRSQVESRLRLSERELHRAYNDGGDEDSGVELTLDWRVASDASRTHAPFDWSDRYDRGNPGWLNPGKLAALGFDTASPPPDSAADTWRERERRVVIVLELDGPTYARSLASARAAAVAARAKSAAAPTDESLAQDAKDAAESLRIEQERASRLFAVDAGLDVAALRGRYPDRNRYALVTALVTMNWYRDTHRQWRQTSGISRVLVPRIHLSRAQVIALGSSIDPAPNFVDSVRLTPFDAEIAYGLRLEPWVVAVHRR